MSEQDRIDEALKRRFEPPDLSALADRIEAAAAASEAPAPDGDAGSGSRMLLLVAALAAALLLALVWPRRSEAPAPDRVASAPTSHQRAGAQLDRFLDAKPYVADERDCMEDADPFESCSAEPGAPTLPPSDEYRVVWECGGTTGIDCAAHDLPAQRMMIVRLLPAGLDVIVCIEPPWADPEPELPADSDYRIFRRTVGDYVLYEVTPLGEPRAAPHLTI